MSILEALWYGNICPAEQPIKKDTEYAVAISNVVAEREKFPSEIQKRIEKLLNAQMDAAVIAERDAFLLGFRLAVQVMMDAMKHSAVTLE